MCVCSLRSLTSLRSCTAARIGSSLGLTAAVPASGHWPLLCSTISLSYEQEEKVRSYQRDILNENSVWMGRHVKKECMDVIEGSYEAMKGLGKSVATRGEGVLSIQQVRRRASLAAAPEHVICERASEPPERDICETSRQNMLVAREVLPECAVQKRARLSRWVVSLLGRAVARFWAANITSCKPQGFPRANYRELAAPFLYTH